MPRGQPQYGPPTQEQLDTFLEYFSQTGHVRQSCKKAGISQGYILNLRKTDPEFRRQFEWAYDMSNTILEDEMVRRATQGVLEPVFYRGNRVGSVRKYSDQLLITLAKGRMREKFGEQLGLSHTGAIGVGSFDYQAAITPIAGGPGDDSETPGEGEIPFDGS